MGPVASKAKARRAKKRGSMTGEVSVVEKPAPAEANPTSAAPVTLAACGQGLPLFYRSSTGAVKSVEVDPDATVGILIAAIRALEDGATPGLTWQGQMLMDHAATLADLGIGPEAIVDASFALPPVELTRDHVSDGTATDAWRPLRPPLKVELRGAPRAVTVACSAWGDQGWGNRKGAVSVRLSGKDGKAKMVHGGAGGLWGIAEREPDRRPAKAELSIEHDVVKQAEPGDELEVVVRVGGGGGHSIEVRGLCFRVVY